MGVLNRGILGGFRGSVGPVVGTSWKGLDVMKSKPLSVANPRTTGQVSQRNKFGAVVAMGSKWLADTVKPLWDRFAQGESGFNAFISANIANFDSLGDIATPESIIIARGTLDVLNNTQAVSQPSPGAFQVTWDTAGGFSTDQVYITMLNETTGYYQSFPTAHTRADGSGFYTSTVPFTTSDVIRVYAAAKRADGTQVSNTSTDTFVA